MAKHITRRILSGATLFIFVMGSMLIGPGLYLSPAQAVGRFSDVVEADLNRVFIDYIVSEGIMNGFPDGDFHPGEGLTRAQAAVIMCNSFQRKINYDADSRFKDVPLSHWSATYIKAAAESGYLNRMPDNIYNPEDALTRAEGVCMVLGLSKQNYTGVKLPPVGDMDENHWAAPAIAMALDAGMLQTEKGDIVRPDSPMTRSELCRALAILLTSDPGLYESKLVGTLTVVKGEVWMGRVGSQARYTVNNSPQVKAGDLIETRNDGEAIIEYPDGSRILLKSNTCIKVKESLGRIYIKKDGTAGIAVDKLELDCPYGEIFGALSTMTYVKDSASQAGQSSVQTHPWYRASSQTRDKVKIATPQSTVVIHGTFWNNIIGANRGGSTSILTGSGAVIVGEQTVQLEQMQTALLSPNGELGQPQPLEQAVLQSIVNNLGFILESIGIQQQQAAAAVVQQNIQNQINLVLQPLQICQQIVISLAPIGESPGPPGQAAIIPQ